MANLFSQDESPEREGESKRPLADRVRPRTLDEVIGQDDLLGEGGPLARLIKDGQARALVFWGPPGTGKTTLGLIIADQDDSKFVHLSAATSGVKEVRGALKESREKFRRTDQRDLLFIDEIHRFNKAQQDVLLPFLEEGSIKFIGATTENPSFELNSAILSRCQVFVFEKLDHEQVIRLVKNALEDERGLGGEFGITEEALETIASFSDGDARRALNLLELSAKLVEDEDKIENSVVENAAQRKSLDYDKGGEEHYNIISALHKTIRNSSPDASLYWLARMLEGGEDPIFIARRLVRVASEDVGLANSQALQVAVAAKQAVELIGKPECDLALAQAVIYLSLAPKSNAIYKAYSKAKKDVEESENQPVPKELRNAPTDLMKEEGYGEGYQYAHNLDEKTADLQVFPENLQGRRYYFPTESGEEKRMKELMQKWIEKRNKKGKGSKEGGE
ncbi:replication-associated recombination protein A [Candidatus Bipolaricaulota bacterium]|nr:replication-associated recombination protein A [Candidatus Bipolaricaulota bacterium]